ncbi:3-dehydroquinate synthase [Clostridiales bacterium PH28_bin88]|nr:3-dehydroquinate synthase [Clostridiales bacterium PH28_bin88]
MGRLTINLSTRSYPIITGSCIIGQLGGYLKKMDLSPKALVVSNSVVYNLYGPEVLDSLTLAKFRAVPALVPVGEIAKSLNVAQDLYDLAVENDLDRRSPVIALGGGVVGDLAGFVAATYMRGVPFIQVPTTLLAQVDSSVGGKVAVNHPKGKNLIGAFHQPRLVLADMDTLRSLPVRELRAGMAEVIKYGVIRDAEFFTFLEENLEAIMALEPQAVEQVVHRSCAIKAAVVEADETEQDLRAILNFGHTIGHAVETLTGYHTYLHGEAVAIGMVTVADIAVRLGWFLAEERDRLVRLIQAAGLPTELPAGLTWEVIVGAAEHDKKAVHDRLTLVLPETIGLVKYHTLSSEELLAVWQ